PPSTRAGVHRASQGARAVLRPGRSDARARSVRALAGAEVRLVMTPESITKALDKAGITGREERIAALQAMKHEGAKMILADPLPSAETRRLSMAWVHGGASIL